MYYIENEKLKSTLRDDDFEMNMSDKNTYDFINDVFRCASVVKSDFIKFKMVSLNIPSSFEKEYREVINDEIQLRADLLPRYTTHIPQKKENVSHLKYTYQLDRTTLLKKYLELKDKPQQEKDMYDKTVEEELLEELKRREIILK